MFKLFRHVIKPKVMSSNALVYSQLYHFSKRYYFIQPLLSLLLCIAFGPCPPRPVYVHICALYLVVPLPFFLSLFLPLLLSLSVSLPAYQPVCLNPYGQDRRRPTYN